MSQRDAGVSSPCPCSAFSSNDLDCDNRATDQQREKIDLRMLELQLRLATEQAEKNVQKEMVAKLTEENRALHREQGKNESVRVSI